MQKFLEKYDKRAIFKKQHGQKKRKLLTLFEDTFADRNYYDADEETCCTRKVLVSVINRFINVSREDSCNKSTNNSNVTTRANIPQCGTRVLVIESRV